LRFAVSICAIELWCLLLCACADTGVVRRQSYVVRPHDTLYSIAWRHDLDYRDLARWNKIGADYRISIGQVLMLGPGSAPAAGPKAPRAAPPSAPNMPGAPNGQGTQGAPGGTSKWVWPTDRVGAPLVVPGGGILLSGRLGQDVRAANTGRVVYTGSGLRGYGNLIIIKHADNLLSAYAHNREMLVHEGQDIAVGQVIAHMGEGAHQSPILYFEIRLNGKPIDPLPFFSDIK
jgi:lipoprotein NlpD